MKKAFLMILLSITVIAGLITWMMYSANGINTRELLLASPVVLIVGFAIYLAVKRIRSARAGLKPEDELSKKIQSRAAAMSYYVSLYWWLFLIYISDRTTLENHSLMGLGITGMAVLYAAFWLYFNFRGKFNE